MKIRHAAIGEASLLSRLALEAKPAAVIRWLNSSPWELRHLWVNPGFMRRGIGRVSLFHALEIAATAGLQELAVDSDPNAEAFYLACGPARVSDRRPGYPANQLDHNFVY